MTMPKAPSNRALRTTTHIDRAPSWKKARAITVAANDGQRNICMYSFSVGKNDKSPEHPKMQGASMENYWQGGTRCNEYPGILLSIPFSNAGGGPYFSIMYSVPMHLPMS